MRLLVLFLESSVARISEQNGWGNYLTPEWVGVGLTAVGLIGGLIGWGLRAYRDRNSDKEKKSLQDQIDEHIRFRKGLEKGALDIKIRMFHVQGSLFANKLEVYNGSSLPDSIKSVRLVELDKIEWRVGISTPQKDVLIAGGAVNEWNDYLPVSVDPYKTVVIWCNDYLNQLGISQKTPPPEYVGKEMHFDVLTGRSGSLSISAKMELWRG